MFSDQIRLDLSGERRQPQSCFETRLMDIIYGSLKTAREFCSIDFPVADRCLPAVIDLKQISRPEDAFAAFKVLCDRLIADIRESVVPAGLACHRLGRTSRDASFTEPCVKDFILCTFQYHDMDSGIPARADPGIFDDFQFAGDSIVIKDRIAIRLICGRYKCVDIASASVHI